MTKTRHTGIAGMDFKYLKEVKISQKLPIFYRALLTALATLAVVFIIAAIGIVKPQTKQQIIHLPTPLPTQQPTATENNRQTQTHRWKIQRGDNLGKILFRAGVYDDLKALLRLGRKIQPLRNLTPGRTLILSSDNGRLMSLQYSPDATGTLWIRREEQAFVAEFEKKQFNQRIAYGAGRIEESLFRAGERAGLSADIIMKLAALFGWDIDFALDIRRGDRFYVIYQQQYHLDERIGDGDIIAAEFHNRGRVFRAVRFKTDKGYEYFSPDGRNMRKAFLRTPVKFSRISSRFSRGRHHPILNRIRAHHGVDYAAPRGTPVKATGMGRVVFRGRKGGYGNTIVIKHGSSYSTLYAHLSRFNRHARRGSGVRQGQVIGYVGSSGLATGPHLHYEFRKHGVHQNPLKVRFPKSSPIDKAYKETFESEAAKWFDQVERIKLFSLVAGR